MRKLAFALLVATYSLAAVAQTPPELKILYIYTDRAREKINVDETIHMAGITNIDQHVSQIHNRVVAILKNSGLDNSANVTIAATTVLLPLSNDWEEPPDNDVGKMLTDFNDNPKTVHIGGVTLDVWMEDFEADIVVLVSDNFLRNGQPVNGAATLLTNIAGNKDNYTVVVDVDRILGETLAHEIGHLGGADHVPATPANSPTINGNVSWPYNDPNGEYATIMSISCIAPFCELLAVFSRPDGEFEDASGTVRNPIGSETQDVTDTLSKTLPKMANYAEDRAASTAPTVPAFCDPDPQFLGCSGPGIAKWAATWNAPLGAVIIEYILELDDTNTGNFEEAYRGELEGLTCPAPGSTDRLIYRVAYRTITGTSPFCTTVNVYRNCPNPYPGGGGPIP